MPPRPLAASVLGGEQQRVAIARAIVNNPALILADEPTGALDSKTSGEILSLFKNLHHEGRTIVVVTHAMDVAECAQRRITIHDGHIVHDDGDGNAGLDDCRVPGDGDVNFFESLRVAWRALRVNKLRSMLTALGIIVGVAAVVCMVSVGAGAQAQVSEKIRTLGANLLLITPAAQSSGGVRMEAGTGHTLTEEDAFAIRRDMRAVQVAAPVLSRRAQVVAGNKNWATLVAGINPDYLIAREWPILRAAHSAPTNSKAARRSPLSVMLSPSSFLRKRRQSAKRCASATFPSR